MVDGKERTSQTKQKTLKDKAIRFPKTGVQYVKKLLLSAHPPELELRENYATNETEIAIRFRGTSNDLPANLREVYFRDGLKPDIAFQEILRATLQQKTIRAELTGLGYNVYQRVWLHIVKANYLDRFRSETNEWLKDLHIKPLEEETRIKSRRKESDLDKENLLRRFNDLLVIARRVHDIAIQVVNDYKVSARNSPKANSSAYLRAKILERIHLYGSRAGYLISSGKAFQLISEADERYQTYDKPYSVQLERPHDWCPDDLATALLAIEEDREYKTVRGKINVMLSKSGPTPK